MAIYIGIAGNPVDGYDHVGPFDYHDEAILYMEGWYDSYEAWHVVKLESQRENKWGNPLVQFARLLCEMEAAGLTEGMDNWHSLFESMDLEYENILELFERANTIWEDAKP